LKLTQALAPLLARLFTAVAELGILPARFHEGLITVIYKSGDRSEPTNYRPITLLCTDYRLFTKVLALPGNAGRYTYSVTQVGNLINVVSNFQINKSIFTQGEYPGLREFYNQVVAKQAEEIVLKKK